MSSYYIERAAPTVLRRDINTRAVTRLTWGEAVAKIDGAATPIQLRVATEARPVRTCLGAYWTARA